MPQVQQEINQEKEEGITRPIHQKVHLVQSRKGNKLK